MNQTRHPPPFTPHASRSNGRRVEPELLDTLPPDDPRALRSRRDLNRVNAWMGNHGIMARALMENTTAPPAEILELGAGDGQFLLRVARKLSMCGRFMAPAATLLDRQPVVSADTLAAFTKIGWRAQAVVADVTAQPLPPAQIVIANLFLHHFEDARLGQLLAAISRRAELFAAVEPHRFQHPYFCGELLRFIGCNFVTRHDAAASVRAGFLGGELSALWPDGRNWRLTEGRAGLFSHLFVAEKIS